MGTENQDDDNDTGERTFTQAEVDKIVGERLMRDRKDRADYDELKKKAARLDELEEASKTELQKATDRAAALQKELDDMKSAAAIKSIREKVAEANGIPVKLITATTEEECTAQAEEILKYVKPNAYPRVPDGGEARTGKAKNHDVRDSFAEWFNQL